MLQLTETVRYGPPAFNAGGLHAEGQAIGTALLDVEARIGELLAANSPILCIYLCIYFSSPYDRMVGTWSN